MLVCAVYQPFIYLGENHHYLVLLGIWDRLIEDDDLIELWVVMCQLVQVSCYGCDVKQLT